MALTITSENLQGLLDSGKPLVIDFWAEWCGPCRMVAPIIDELAGEYEGRVTIGKCDVDSNDFVHQERADRRHADRRGSEKRIRGENRKTSVNSYSVFMAIGGRLSLSFVLCDLLYAERIFSVVFLSRTCDDVRIVFPFVVAVPYLFAQRTEIAGFLFLSAVGKVHLQCHADTVFFGDNHTRTIHITFLVWVVYRQSIDTLYRH